MDATKILIVSGLWLGLFGCGSTETGNSCGPGTTSQNGQCVVANAGASGGGAAGTGGDASGGLAGSSAGGQSTADPCLGLDVIATGSPGLIDDFEDGDVTTLNADGRHGAWDRTTDCTFTPVELMPEPPLSGMTIDNASSYALHVSGTACSNGFSVGTQPNPHPGIACAYDATAYDGVYFWAMGAGLRVSLLVALRSTFTTEFGGTGACETDAGTGCWDHYGAPVTLTADWEQYSFLWADLHQAGWGTAVPWDVTLVNEVALHVTQDQADTEVAEFSFDNVGFFKGMPPVDPP